MTRSRTLPRIDPSTKQAILGLLLIGAPLLIPILLVLLLLVAFLVLMVVDAFGDGFVQGTAAVAALIGIPSIVMLWLSKVLQVLGGRAPVRRPMTDVERRYATGDFIHRDYAAERRAHESR